MQRILIVDDISEVFDLLKMVLEPCGYLCEYAGTGQEALDKYAAYEYPLMLADLNMKPMNGLELLEKAKAQYPATHIVLMSGHLTPEVREQAKAKGAVSVLEKPFPLDQLGEIIGKLIPPREEE